MYPQTSSAPGPSQDRRPAAVRAGSSNSGESDGSILRAKFARKTPTLQNSADISGSNGPANGPDHLRQAVRDDSDRPAKRANASTLVSKQARTAAAIRKAAPQAPVPQPNDNAQHRMTMRKTAMGPQPARRPQSSFTYMAPLLRVTARPQKSSPLRASHLVAQEEREKQARQEDGEYALGTRSTPRMAVSSMSVQRRGGPSPRKTVTRAAPPPDRPVNLDDIPDAPVYIGRGGKMVYRGDTDESSSDDGGLVRSPVVERRALPARKRVMKAARKTPVPEGIVGDTASGSGTRGQPSSLGKKARKIDRVSDSDEESPGLSARPRPFSQDDTRELRDAFDALTLAQARLKEYRKLPFLLRNLRDGFESRCRRNGVPIGPEDVPKRATKVVYRYYIDESDSHESDNSSTGGIQEYQQLIGSMDKWFCPICNLHKPFRRREMLAFHLAEDHDNVKVAWKEVKVHNEARWDIDIVLPDIDELEEDSSDDASSRSPSPMEEDVEGANQGTAGVELLDARSFVAPFSPIRDPLFLPGSDSEDSPPPPAPPPAHPVSAVRDEDIKPLVVPAIVKRKRSQSPIGPKRTYSVSVGVRKSYRGSLPARFPSPPPPTDRLGPAAQYPYLPDDHEHYSCRIGGPRIFDLLNTLPMEEFGIMSWAIIDREEELFEMEDVRDEDKVMLALWNRWIMINRKYFIFNEYLDGVIKFINQYWEMIHQAAGWRALRAFLLMLSVNKYLELDQVLIALKHYEKLTGMDYWYKDGDGERS